MVYRFAKHPRFILWIYNIHYRHRTLGQGDIYIKQHPGDANLSVQEIPDLLTSKRPNNIINNIRRYMANIPGTISYWYNINAKLKEIIESKGPPHVFFTLSFADRYF